MKDSSFASEVDVKCNNISFFFFEFLFPLFFFSSCIKLRKKGEKKQNRSVAGELHSATLSFFIFFLAHCWCGLF